MDLRDKASDETIGTTTPSGPDSGTGAASPVREPSEALTSGAAGPATRARAELNKAAILEPGTILGDRYEILQMLGLGGMGAVYKAHDRHIDRVIALKVIRPDLANNPELLARFKQELLLAREISHKNVVRIFDLHESNGVKFITMEFVAGRDLDSLLAERGKLPATEAIEIMRQVCSALAAAHEEGILHRDLKPSNIMRDASGRVVLMDFGLARTVDGHGMTQTGTMLGTIEYMSPEQARAEALDARSDLFAVGLILYEVLTGKLPYKADSAIASLLKRSQEAAPPISNFDPTLPASLVAVVAKCLERERNMRFNSATELIEALDAVLGRRPSSVQISSARAVRPHQKWIWMGAVAVLVLVAAGIAARWLLRPRPAAVPQKSVSILVADFQNYTGDPIFDGTLEPMLNVALEGASFMNAYSRGQARKLAEKLPHPTDKLDEQSARLVAVSEGVDAVITGNISLRGEDYIVSATVLDTVTGKVLGEAKVSSKTKDGILGELPKLAAPLRTALGDTTPASVQFAQVSGGFQAANLEAVHQDAIGLEQQFAGKLQDAFNSFAKAAELDPNFARAYSGMAAMARNLGRPQDAEKYIKLALQHEDRMTERERYRTRGLYYLSIGDWQNCVEEDSQLVSRYPSDRVGQANIATCYAQLRNIPKAVEAARRAVEIEPNAATQRLNLAFLESWSGDFQGGEHDARTALKLSPSSVSALLTLAESQVGQGHLSEAADTYQTLQSLSPLGASLASTGRADLFAYEGRFADAARLLDEGAAADLAAKNPDNAGDKLAALARVQLSRGDKRAALVAANKALANSQAVPTRFLVALVFIHAGELDKAQKLAAGLGAELQAEPQSYGKIIEGRLAAKRGDNGQAVAAMNQAIQLLDTWIAHFELGQVYLQSGAFVEADSEFDRCMKRRGEATELFNNNVPTFSYVPDVYYYQGRVKEGLKSPAFADSYRTYFSIRGQAGEDPRLAEIRPRLGAPGN